MDRAANGCKPARAADVFFFVLGCLLLIGAPPVLGAGQPADPLARLADQFGQIYSQGRYADAAKVAAEILGYLQSHRGPLDLDLAADLNNLGSLAYAQGKLDLAEPFYRKSLEIYEKVLGPRDSNAGAVLYNLAGLYAEQGRLDDALELYRRCLAIREAALGQEHPLVAETLNNIGVVHLSRGTHQEAESAFRRALEIWQKHAGSDAPYGAITLNNLGRLKTAQRQFAEAEKCYQQARAIEEAVFGKEHPETAITVLNLADLYKKSGQSGRASETTSEALAILRKTLGPSDPLTERAERQLEELDGHAQPRDRSANSGVILGRYQILAVKRRSEAEALREKLRSGAAFETLASEFSLDPSRENGGFFSASPDDLNETLRTSLAMLGEGELSAPFRLGRDWAIVKKVAGP